MRRASKMIALRLEPGLHALIPEICRQHSHRSISEIIRRMLWTEVERLGLKVAPKLNQEKARGRHRYTT